MQAKHSHSSRTHGKWKMTTRRENEYIQMHARMHATHFADNERQTIYRPKFQYLDASVWLMIRLRIH